MKSTAGDNAGAAAEGSGSLAVAVGGDADAAALVERAADLADALGLPWEAVHVEIPEGDRESPTGLRAAAALKLAASRGGTVSTVAAATVADGLTGHIAGSTVRHLVLGRAPRSTGRGERAAAVGKLLKLRDVALHVFPHGEAEPSDERSPVAAGLRERASGGYVFAVAAVLGTVLAAAVFRLFVPPRSLDLLFLFPVIAVAARAGLRPALVAGALSVVVYNYFVMAPAFELDVAAPQNVVMAIVLFGVAGYTSTVTGRLRARLFLSDRSARENADLAAFAQRLTRDGDWNSTAGTVCEQIASQFNVRSALFREVGGTLVLVRAVPELTSLDPLDQAALEWCWNNGERSGAGTSALGAANWQFRPLATSLGMLAVLALARDDGRDPVRAEQELLLSTIIAQAALAHERLRLEEGAPDRPAG